MARHPTRTINPKDDPVNDARSLAQIPDDVRDLYAQPVPQDFIDEEAEVNAVLAEAGGEQGGGSVVIRKLNPSTRKYEWLAKHAAAEFLSMGGVAYLASKHGGGEYELIVYGVDSRILKRPKFTVAASVVADMRTQESAQISGVDKLANAMLEGFKQLATQQTQMLQQLQRPAESKAQWLQELAMMRELFGANRGGSDLDALLKVAPIFRDLMPRGEGETNFLDVMMQLAREFAPAIRTAVEKSPALTAALAAPKTTEAARPSLTPEQQGASQMQMMLKAQLAMLCNEAKRNSDPGPYAAIIVDRVSPEVLGNLVNNPDWLNELGKVHSAVKLFPTWFGELREAVVEIMTDPGEGGDLTDDPEAGTSQEISEEFGISGAHVPESGNDTDT